MSELAILGQWSNQFRPRLLAMLERRIDPRLRSRIDPEEILQDANLKAYGRWKKSRGTAPVESYIWWYGLAYDCLVASWKTNTRQMRDLQRDVPLPSNSSVLLSQIIANDELKTPSREVSEKERQQLVQIAMDQLRDEQKEILWMRHYDQLKHREIAEQLKCTKEAAMLRYSRALLKLRKTLDAMGFSF